MVDSKVEAILAFTAPKSVKQLQSFLGICNFYRSFIPNDTEICGPLLKLLKKGSKFSWLDDANRAFHNLKQLFKSGIILRLPNRNEQFHLYCDASNHAIGAALHQYAHNGFLQPVAFFSRKLTDSEKNYAIYDKELLAIKEPLSHWRHLLISTSKPILIYSDHDNLTYFKSSQKRNQRQARWQQFLSDYNFTIKYISGSKNKVADALSRRSDFITTSIHESVLLPTSHFINSIEGSVVELFILSGLCSCTNI
jgi:hypothetical protein